MLLFLMMLIMGLLLGFAGGGGSGFILALLISFFGVPVHTALGTSMTAMIFTVLSGAFSHFREGNMSIRTGMVVGLFGASGSYLGTFVGSSIPAHILVWITAGMLFLSAFLIWLRIHLVKIRQASKIEPEGIRRPYFWIYAPCIGVVTGFLSGTFGIGSTPLIQLGIMVLLGLSLQQAASTTMIIILPIALFGAVGFSQAGYVDWHLLLLIVAGTMTGSYIGAKYTSRAPLQLLLTVIIGLPILSGVLLLW